ncbi:hypothetical protein GWI33_013129 [Rhynchophorus ferrugineus]|uniref:Uncharacterized protein n=1 Tax=Rhynchophorus ferrugineus TaxID=354439 RepID=A0A834I9Y6_RHYFE|nr:hypothetical protein GWI33_013129 [Rhynchophorus ferrugineus]
MSPKSVGNSRRNDSDRRSAPVPTSKTRRCCLDNQKTTYIRPKELVATPKSSTASGDDKRKPIDTISKARNKITLTLRQYRSIFGTGIDPDQTSVPFTTRRSRPTTPEAALPTRQ